VTDATQHGGPRRRRGAGAQRTHLSVLAVDESDDDVLLVMRELQAGGFRVVWERVEDDQAMADALDRCSFDIIVSESQTAGLRAADAVALCRQKHVDAPFFVISSQITEDDSGFPKSGVTDVFLKSDLSRLSAVVWEALRKVDPGLGHSPEWREPHGELFAADVLHAVGGRPGPTLAGRAEETLTSSERLFRTLFDEALDAILITDDAGRYLAANPAAAALFGVPRQDLLGRSLIEMSDDSVGTTARWREFVQMGHGIGDVRIKRVDGASRDVEFTARANFLPGLHLAIVRDVTERRREARALCESEARYRRLFEGIPHPVIVSDPQTKRVLAANPAACREYGRALDEMVALTVDRLRCPDAPDVIAGFRIEADDVVHAGSTRHCRKDGTAFDAEVSVHALVLAGQPAVLSMIKDVTAERQLEEQRRQAQKMDSIGHFAGGIAHDFNNVLSVIMGYAESAGRRLPPGSEARAKIDAILRAAESAASLTRQLLAFSRKQVLVPRLLDLGVVVDDLGNMLRRLIGEDVELMTVVHPGLDLIRADPGQLEQVILNLAANARDAMPRGGQLVLEMENAQATEEDARTHVGLKPGRYVVLRVRDTGTGMSAEVQKRVFEPFYTTKELGKGTGLGLATVYGIVKQSGGYIAVESEPGVGTCFSIYLPRARGAAASPREELRMSTSASPRGSDAVLFVEDDAVMRVVAEEALAAFGYRVAVAASGREAIELYESGEQRPAILVTDLVMPRMSGRELADELMRRQPDLRVLFISGYSSDAVMRQQVAEEGRAFLQKPFTPVALARRIRELLDTAPT